MKKIVVLGAGKMGSWLVESLCLDYDVGVFDPDKAKLKYFFNSHKFLSLEEIRDFQPDLVIVSAGFDAHEKDPLGQLELRDEDYGWITAEIHAIANDFCTGRLLSMLEGGYDLDALASASAAHVEALTA